MVEFETIEIGGNFKNKDAPTITLNGLDDISNFSEDMPSKSSKKSSVNFGSGIELLMNEKRKNDGTKSNQSSDVDLGDINELENELNGLSAPREKSKGKTRSSLFNSVLSGEPTIKLNDISGDNFNGLDNISLDDQGPTIKIGKETAKDPAENKTWDGFQKFNDIPLDPSKRVSAPAMGREELLREKLKVLRRLEDLENKGVKLSKKYNMESNLQEMQGEYEMIVEEKEKSNSVKFQGRALMAIVTGLEFLNNKIDPFDIKLDGWSEQINENINDYDEIFAELHEKYKSKGKMAPELKLLFQLGGSAIMVHMTNTMFKSSMPGMDDIMRQNPELMQQFTQAAVNSMGQSSPGFAGFMNNFMPSGGGIPQPPPPPMATQQSTYRPNQQGPMNRPDLSTARGDGINIQENQARAGGAERSIKRPEMKGPRDINDIISSMKTKSINIQQPTPTQTLKTNDESGSTISVKDLDDTKSKMPGRSKRKPRSEKNLNTVSLDI